MTAPDNPPAIPPIVRTVAYFVALISGAAGTATVAITAVVHPSAAATVAGVVGVILGAVTSIAGGLGVAYRPTADLTRR